MLGIFAFILVCSVVIIGLSVLNIFAIDRGIVQIHEKTRERFVLENIVQYILEEELAERQYLLREGDPMIVERYNQASAKLDALVAELKDLADSPTEVKMLEREWARIEQDYAEIVASYSEDEGATHEFVNRILAADLAVDQQLDDLVFDAETALEEKLREVSRLNQTAIMIGLGGLILFPLLAVWAFSVASRITQPLLSLTNAVIAIEGDRYRDELLAQVIHRRDGLGGLARGIEAMARAVEAREEDLDRKVDELGQQLHEVRQRKLVPTSSTHSPVTE